MKTQKITKSSKFTQATPNDNEYSFNQNIGMTVLPTSPSEEGNRNMERITYPEGHFHNVNKSSEMLLRSNYEAQSGLHESQRFSPESNANRYQQTHEIELCNCIAPIQAAKTRFAHQCNSEQTLVLNRSFASLPKLENTNLSQVSLDRKSGKFRPKHSYVCEQNRRILREMDKDATLRRIQSPEIINIHRGPFYEGHSGESSEVKGFKCKDREFRRGQSVRTIGTRSAVIPAHPKRRPAGDGMDAEIDDPELVFEMTSAGHLGDCQCPCDHVVYSPTAYTTCLQISVPAEIQIISINKCPGFNDKDVRLQLEVDRGTQTISGNISLDYDLDVLVKLNLREKSHSKYPIHPLRSFVNQTSFCKLIGTYINTDDIYYSEESETSESICPISGGLYTVTAATAKFTVMTSPHQRVGKKWYQMELMKNGVLLLCREFEVELRLKNVN